MDVIKLNNNMKSAYRISLNNKNVNIHNFTGADCFSHFP